MTHGARISGVSAMSRCQFVHAPDLGRERKHGLRGRGDESEKNIFALSRPSGLGAPNCAECIGYEATNRLNRTLMISTSPRQTDMKYDVTGTWKLCAGDEQIAPQTVVFYALKLTSLVVVIFSMLMKTRYIIYSMRPLKNNTYVLIFLKLNRLTELVRKRALVPRDLWKVGYRN